MLIWLANTPAAPCARLRLPGCEAMAELQLSPVCRAKQQVPGTREKLPGAVPVLTSPTLAVASTRVLWWAVIAA